MIPSEILFERLRDRFEKVADEDTGFRAGTVDEAVAHMRAVIAGRALTADRGEAGGTAQHG